MTVDNLLFFAKSHIHKDHAKILLAELLNKNPLELLTCLDEEVSPEKEKLFRKEVEYLKNGKPLQYVLGNINFYGTNFYINENVLIPRFETEQLVEKTISYINEKFSFPVDIIDLGCGSGVIGLTLEKKVSSNSIDLIDISSPALEVAKVNCQNLNSKAKLIQSDMWQNISKRYHVIISNPPYIKTTEEIEDIVKDNEPHLALYAGEDGLDCYRKILFDIKEHMQDKCLIAFEIGSTQGEALKKLVFSLFPNAQISIEKDLADRNRFFFIFKNI